MKSVSFVINDDEWEAFLYTDAEYIEEFDEGSEALCYPSLKKMFFKVSEFNRESVLHEMTHAYYSYICVDSCNDIKSEDYEEIFADFVCKYVDKIVKKTNFILRELKKKKDETNE